MTSCCDDELVHLQQKVEWALLSCTRFNQEYDKIHDHWRHVTLERQFRGYNAGDHCDWSEYGTNTLHDLFCELSRLSTIRNSKKREFDEYKKQLDDYLTAIAVPCAEYHNETGDAEDEQVAPAVSCHSTELPSSDGSSSSDDDDEYDE